MAVYQISKIQIRRGKERSGPGIPDLASGELAWAVDSQSLYIGNGSISEGAPTVGRTKILTSKDLLSGSAGLIASLSHTYKSSDATITTGTSVSFPISRPLSDVLDDTVNLYDFGAKGDGSTNDTVAINRALSQLFANFNLKAFLNTQEGVKRRVILRMPAGIFVINGTLAIPSYATVIGAGSDKTIIRYTGGGTAFRCISDSNSTYPITNPRYIHLQGFTIQTDQVTAVGLDITNSTNSVFQDIKISGSWALVEATDNKAINIDSVSATTADNVVFNNITINNFYYGVYAGNASTHITFNNGSISNANIGFALGIDLTTGTEGGGPSNYHVTNYKFNQIAKQAFISNIGIDNSITNCDLTNVGGVNTLPSVPQIYFEQPGNYNSNIRSDRSVVLSDPTLLVTYIPEVSGVAVFTSSTKVVSISFSADSINIIRLPLRRNSSGVADGSISYVVNYTFNGGEFARQGQLFISAKSPNITSSEDFTCNTSTNNAILLNFTVSINNGSILISYTNNLTGNQGFLTYSYTAVS